MSTRLIALITLMIFVFIVGFISTYFGLISAYFHRIRKYFTLPGPKDLGMSKYNRSMASSLFNNSGEPTWEDYYAKLKELYPIRYTLLRTIPRFFSLKFYFISRYLDEARYYIVSHTVRRYHMLDLRQPGLINDTDSYRYGWVDSDRQIEFALFNILNNFMKNEFHLPIDEELPKDSNAKEWRDGLSELKEIHNWWNVQRKIDVSKESTLLRLWSSANRNKDQNLKEHYWNELRAMEDYNRAKLDNMVVRLVAARHFMWT